MRLQFVRTGQNLKWQCVRLSLIRREIVIVAFTQKCHFYILVIFFGIAEFFYFFSEERHIRSTTLDAKFEHRSLHKIEQLLHIVLHIFGEN